MSKHIVSLIIGIIILTIGFTLAFTNGINYEYENTNPDIKINVEEKTYKYNITDEKYYINTETYNNVIINYDNNLENEMIVKITYPKDILSLKYKETDANHILIFNEYHKRHFFEATKLFIESIKLSVKNKKIYNYSTLTTSTINIYINESNKDNIEINKIRYYDFDLDFSTNGTTYTN